MSPKINNIGFGAHEHLQKSLDHENERGGVNLSHNQIEKQNNPTKLLAISFPHISHKNDPKMPNESPNYFCPIFVESHPRLLWHWHVRAVRALLATTKTYLI